MPRTRNITRAQWDAANATNSITAGDHSHGCESEKENEGRPATRATRSQTRRRNFGNRVLGSTTTANLRISTSSKGPENTVSANKTKVKGKGRATAPPPKRKKFPLQDITSQFLPAPEAANRGEENEPEHATFQQAEQMVNLVSPSTRAQILVGEDAPGPAKSTRMSHPDPTYLDSPLPPSSPPSAITSSPQYPKILHNPNPPQPSPEYNFWNQFEDGRRASQGSPSVISSSSDPFGFVALERKLKVERRAAIPSPLKRHHQEDESDEELGLVLVADTSSPRLVRRLKRSSYQGDSPLPPAISEHPIYATPPTPHKDKKRPRLSHEGDHVFSPCSSSMPSTPSPSKPLVQRQVGREDTLKSSLQDNQEVEGVFGRTRNRTAHGKVKSEPSATSKVTKTPLELGKSLYDDAETEGEQADPKRLKVAKSKKNAKKPRSVGTKKLKKEKNDGDYEEVCSLPGSYSIKLSGYQKWEQERQERAAYFKRLEGYQVEKEDVCVI